MLPRPGGRELSDREAVPGFPDGVSGGELADSAYRQAQRLGAEFLIGVLVVHARPQPDGSVEVEFSSGCTIRARSGLIATRGHLPVASTSLALRSGHRPRRALRLLIGRGGRL